MATFMHVTLHCVGDQWLHQQLKFTLTLQIGQSKRPAQQCTGLLKASWVLPQSCHQFTSPSRHYLVPANWLLVAAVFHSSSTQYMTIGARLKPKLVFVIRQLNFRTSIFSIFTDFGALLLSSVTVADLGHPTLFSIFFSVIPTELVFWLFEILPIQVLAISPST